jgi:hypothetical protein
VTLSSSAVTDRTATLSWRPSDDSRFREYRVYMSRNQALTEETGTLVYVGTDRSATTVQVGTPYYPGQDLSPEAPLQPLTTYFFRVFVMDDRGLLGGSNLLEVNTGSFPTNQFEIEYDLVLTSSFAAQGRLGGIAWDGSCLWIVYYERGPEFLDPDPTRLVCRDLATGQTLVEHLYVDDSRSPGGLGWDGTHLWLHIVGSASQPPSTLKIIDPATFSVVDHFAAPPNTTDMAWDGQSLLVAISRNRIEFIDPLWGGWLREVYTPFRFQSLKGVAYRDGEIWALSGAHPQLAVLSPDGRQIGVGYTEVLRPGYRNAAGGYLTFVGDQLVLAEEARIYIFDLAPR